MKPGVHSLSFSQKYQPSQKILTNSKLFLTNPRIFLLYHNFNGKGNSVLNSVTNVTYMFSYIIISMEITTVLRSVNSVTTVMYMYMFCYIILSMGIMIDNFVLNSATTIMYTIIHQRDSTGDIR